MIPKGFQLDTGQEYVLKCCAFMGLDVFLRDSKKNLLYYISFWTPWFYHFCCLYSIYILRDDPVTILKCLSIWGSAGQVCIKFHMAQFHQQIIRESFNFIKLKHQDAAKDPEIKEKFLKSNKIFHMIQKLIFYSFNFSLVFIFSYPLLIFILYGKRIFLVVNNTPGLNPDAEAGFPDYEIQTAIHIFTLLVGVNMLVPLEGLFVYFVLNGATVADTLIIYIRRFCSLLDQNSLGDADTTECMRHLSYHHQEYIHFVNRLEKMYNLTFLLQFGTYALSCSIGIYTAKLTGWYAILYITACNVFQLFFTCALGSIIESKNSKILDELYKTNWTEMSVKNRRMLLFMMHRARTQKSMTVGNLKKLNLETGMDIYKIIYSYTILLQDAVNV